MHILGYVVSFKGNVFELSHRGYVGSASLLYRYFHGRCSKELYGSEVGFELKVGKKQFFSKKYFKEMLGVPLGSLWFFSLPVSHDALIYVIGST
jgi:hypothetical protein